MTEERALRAREGTAIRDDRSLDELLASLQSPDRSERLRAAFALGEVLAARGGPLASDALARRAIEALEALSRDPGAGSWLRKRARRALRKIRGASDRSASS